ncbi:LysM peptidoglycan-binding domain-containing M23 family metallopeptidase [Deinococcus arboris]|nr:M23 family metallopeptidase [Deinococcus arboris]
MMRRTALLAALLLVGGAAAYTVKPGDTLYSIARRSGTTVEALVRLNSLKGTTLEVGQTLQLPGAAAPTPAPPARPAPLPAAQLAPTPSTVRIAGVNITVPASLRMGEAFVLRLSGARAGQATVRFPSEVGEDVRQPAEALKPIGAAGEYAVPGRVVLGKTTPVVYEVTLDGALVRGRIPVNSLEQPIQHLNLPARISGVLQDPARQAEDALVEKAYARRTTQAWTRPFAPALEGVRPTSSSFGQPRTYVAGGPVAYHFGTDYPARSGTPVLAVNDGTVVIAGRYPVRGGLVVIDHGAGVTSLYFHQSRVTAKVGQKVSRGDKLGEVGTTGLSAGPHLHLEIRVRGEGTNPAGWMNRLWPK